MSHYFINDVFDYVDFCLEYAYYLSDDGVSVTLYEKYINSDAAIKHGQNFMSGPFFDRFFNLFTLEIKSFHCCIGYSSKHCWKTARFRTNPWLIESAISFFNAIGINNLPLTSILHSYVPIR